MASWKKNIKLVFVSNLGNVLVLHFKYQHPPDVVAHDYGPLDRQLQIRQVVADWRKKGLFSLICASIWENSVLSNFHLGGRVRPPLISRTNLLQTDQGERGNYVGIS